MTEKEYSDFLSLLRKEKEKTDRYLDTFLSEHIKDLEKFADKDFLFMAQNIRSLILRGGKRARPLLVRLGYKIAGGKDSSKIFQASLFAELIHSFFLIHDDIADKDLVRYGGDTLEVSFHKRFLDKFNKEDRHMSKTFAMLAGDHVRTLAYQALHKAGFSADVTKACEQIMLQTETNTLVGWSIQYWQNHQEIKHSSEEKFMKGLELVTSKYSFEAPLLIGAQLAGSLDVLRNPFTNYARHVGIAFQLQDDILGVFGNPKETGKPVGNDLREGKKTLLVLRSFERASKQEKDFISSKLGNDISEKDLYKIRGIIEKTGVLSEVQKLAHKHVAQSRKALADIETTQTDTLAILHTLADFSVARSF